MRAVLSIFILSFLTIFFTQCAPQEERYLKRQERIDKRIEKAAKKEEERIRGNIQPVKVLPTKDSLNLKGRKAPKIYYTK